MKTIKLFLATLVFGLFVAAPVASTVVTAPVSADNHTTNCEPRFLGIPPWYRGLTDSSNNCAILGPNDSDGIAGYITKIALNLIEAVIVIIAYIAVFNIIFGGFRFITNGSDPGAVEKARKSITNAVIGLVIALAAVAIVNFIFEIIPEINP